MKRERKECVEGGPQEHEADPQGRHAKSDRGHASVILTHGEDEQEMQTPMGYNDEGREVRLVGNHKHGMITACMQGHGEQPS